MLKNFLLGLSGNKSIVFGHKNITIQDIRNATVNINSLDFEQVKEAMAEFLGDTKKTLYFVVHAKFDAPPFDWKPFGGQTILDIIESCTKGLPNTKSVVWFISHDEDLDDDAIDEIKGIVKDSILMFSTNADVKGELYDCFNHYHIGGCIAIPSLEAANYSNNLGTLTRLRTKIENIHRHKKTFQYALKHIKTDEDIAESINNIITAYMGHSYDPAKSIVTTDNKSAIKTLPNL